MGRACDADRDGGTLIAEGFGAHVPKGYIYAAIAFSSLSIHDPIANLFHLRRDHRSLVDYRAARAQAFETWAEVAGARLAA